MCFIFRPNPPIRIIYIIHRKFYTLVIYKYTNAGHANGAGYAQLYGLRAPPAERTTGRDSVSHVPGEIKPNIYVLPPSPI